MPLPTTAELRAEAERLEAEAAEKLKQARAWRRAADELEGRKVAGPRAIRELGLTSDADSTTLQDVSATGSEQLARGMAKSRSKKHPFVRALYEHPDPKKRVTVAQWAVANKYKPGTVSSWYAKGDGARRIPLSAAQKIEAQFGVPATSAVWKNGINTDE